MFMWDENDSHDDYDLLDEAEHASEEDVYAHCPFCNAEIYDDSVQCTQCGNFIIENTSTLGSSRLASPWIVIPVVLVLIIAIFLMWVLNIR